MTLDTEENPFSRDEGICGVLQRKLLVFFYAVINAKAALRGIVFILTFKNWSDLKNVSAVVHMKKQLK